ncbi:hypothetical protein AGMMS49938_05530 [Fibrobacterales bacterium]|nr:hypothetical protein AGMMS49938_05530 [Fibrobacterales bacterium]
MKCSFLEFMKLWFLRKGEKRKLRIVGNTSLKFPSGDIAKVEWGKREVVLELNEMSLFGSDSPFEDNFLHGIRCEYENSVALREFLNIFQQHLAMLRFNSLSFDDPKFLEELGNLLWQKRFLFYEEMPSLEYLQSVYEKQFPNAEISVHGFAPCKIKNHDPLIMGKCYLNGDYLLGENCISLTRCVSVIVEREQNYQKIILGRKI